MKHEPLFPLCDEDARLFDQMKTLYQSDEERIFFETMCYKEKNEPAYSNELLLLEDENEDRVYLIRCSEHEYEYGSELHGKQYDKYADSLSEMLLTNLSELGVTSMEGTILDWLRGRNYKGIQYDRNIALM